MESESGFVALYSDELISEIMAANDIVDIVSSYVSLKRSSGGYMGLCPFHNEKTPSFHVSQTKQLFHCFGCGEGGTVIHFIMKMENLDFVETVKYLADRAGIALPEERSFVSDETHEKRRTIFEMNKEAARFFYQRLEDPEKGQQTREYLAKRQLGRKTAMKFGLGVSGNEYGELYEHLKTKGYSLDEMLLSGLVMKNDRGCYDRFRKRLMFPIFDLRSNIIGFGGRVLDDSMPKYLNSPETMVFNKGSNIFGLNIAKNFIKDSLILVEGYMDVISLHQSGIQTAVATLGTALTEEQAKLLARYAKTIYICYDSDEAGRNATLRAIDLLEKTSVRAMVCDFTGAKDPDEYVKTKGSDAFLRILKTSWSAVMYKIELLKRKYNLDDVEEKIIFVKEAALVLAKLTSYVELEAYVGKVSDYCGISRESLYAEIRKNVAKNNKQDRSRYYKDKNVYNKREIKPNMAQGKPSLTSAKLCEAQRELLTLAAERKDLFLEVKENLTTEDFSEGVYRKAAEYIYSMWEAGKEPNGSEYLNTLSAEDVKEASPIFLRMITYTDGIEAVNSLTHTIKDEKYTIAIRNEQDFMRKSELIKQQQILRKEGQV